MSRIRYNKDIKYIVLHHSTHKTAISGVNINKNYIASGDFGVPYDIIINTNGKIDLSPVWIYANKAEQYTEDIGAKDITKYFIHHLSTMGDTVEYNRRAIHIALIGDFDYIKPTLTQFLSLKSVLRQLSKKLCLDLRSALIYHRDILSTSCPGVFFPDRGELIADIPVPVCTKATYPRPSEPGANYCNLVQANNYNTTSVRSGPATIIRFTSPSPCFKYKGRVYAIEVRSAPGYGWNNEPGNLYLWKFNYLSGVWQIVASYSTAIPYLTSYGYYRINDTTSTTTFHWAGSTFYSWIWGGITFTINWAIEQFEEVSAGQATPLDSALLMRTDRTIAERGVTYAVNRVGGETGYQVITNNGQPYINTSIPDTGDNPWRTYTGGNILYGLLFYDYFPAGNKLLVSKTFYTSGSKVTDYVYDSCNAIWSQKNIALPSVNITSQESIQVGSGAVATILLDLTTSYDDVNLYVEYGLNGSTFPYSIASQTFIGQEDPILDIPIGIPLALETTYYCRVVAANTKGTVRSNTVTIITPEASLLAQAQARYDAGRITGVADGEEITEWRNINSNNYHLVSTTPGRGPLYKTEIVNARPVIRFQANTLHSMRATGYDPAFAADAKVTIFLVVKGSQTSIAQGIVIGTALGLPEGYGFGYTSNNNSELSYNHPTPEQLYTLTKSIVNQFNVLFFSRDGLDIKIGCNSSIDPVATIGGYDVPTSIITSVGYYIPAVEFINNFKGDIAEMVIFSNNLTDTEMLEASGILMNKYNII
jgi:hypothetical protein